MPTWLTVLLIALFPVSEVAMGIFKRANPETAHSVDRGSLRLLWIAITLAVTAAVACQWVTAARLPRLPVLRLALFLGLYLAGLALRWAAILHLGRYFTMDVAIHESHALVQSGLYFFVRHPSYTGLLVAFAGLSFYYWNWLSMLALMLPIGAAVGNRIAQEERALRAAFGAEYDAYCARTARLIPGLL